jgi:DNA-binding CsgD family transcriptional regulator
VQEELQRLVGRMQAAASSAEAVECLRQTGEVIGLRLPCALNDVSANAPVYDHEGRRIADLLGWPGWMTDNWFDHAYVRQHPIYLRCRFENLPFGDVYADLWKGLAVLSPAQQQMKKDVERLGVLAQITVPVHLALGRTACVLWSTCEPADIDAILATCGPQLLAIGHLFMAAMQPRQDQTARARERELAHLSDRQIECLYWLANGKTIRETAIILDISAHTVRQHLRIIVDRLQAVNTVHAVALAAQFGIIGRLP